MPKLFIFKHLSYILGLAFIITGLVFVSKSEANIKSVFIVAGILFAIRGINASLSSGFFQIRDVYSLGKFTVGPLLGFLGLTVLVISDSGLKVLGLVVGLLALVSAAEKIIFTLEAKSKGEHYAIILLYSFILTALGLMLLWTTVQNMEVLLTVFGIYVMVEGSLIMLGASYVREPGII